jgi:hypothetical protein
MTPGHARIFLHSVTMVMSYLPWFGHRVPFMDAPQAGEKGSGLAFMF